MNTLSVDQAHVLLDAIDAAERRIDNQGWAPWRDYWAGYDDDPKANRDGYRELLATARAALGKVISEEGATS